MYQRSPVHEALFRLIQPVSATGFLTTVGKLTEEDTCFLVNFGGNSLKVFITVIEKEEKEALLKWNRRRKESYVFRISIRRRSSPDSTIFPFFPFSSEFWSAKWKRVLRGPPSRKYAGLKALIRFTLLSKWVLKWQRSRFRIIVKRLLSNDSRDEQRSWSFAQRSSISIDFSRRESIM